MAAPSAIAIALPLLRSLHAKPFAGAVASQFTHACNLADDDGRVIALTLPVLGNGPFSIVVEADIGRFMQLQLGQRADVDARRIVVGGWNIPLTSACIWDSTLPTPGQIKLGSQIVTILQPYLQWPTHSSDTPVATAMTRLLARGARALSAALERGNDLAEAARQLAGLGHGLTPAGDDYLVGAMAALWLLGDRDQVEIIAQSAAPHTTTLSSAFLAAAGLGQFLEPWHQMARALAGRSELECRAAALRIAAIGASSGRDALAGFAASVLARLAD